MTSEEDMTSEEEANVKEAAGGLRSRQNERSTIAFPYLDLDSAIEMAKGVYRAAGHGEVEVDHLAAEMGLTVSGSFRLKLSTTRMYQLIDKAVRSRVILTDLGRRIVQPDTEADARAQAFLGIPLYEQIFSRYRGQLLPQAKALEWEMQSFGVARKQTGKARQIFERSARQAGFFAHGEDRLVQPKIDAAPQTKPVPSPEPQESASLSSAYDGGGNKGEGASGKPLEYQLIDLLKQNTMEKDEQQAVWTLVSYLARAESGAKPKKTADDDTPPAV